jgi:hypothetical protein
MMRRATAGLAFMVLLMQAAALRGASVGSYYQLDPQSRYTNVSGKLNITVGNPFTIVSPYSSISSDPALYTMPNGSIQLVFQNDAISDPGHVAITSSNQGQTWTPAPNAVHRFDAGGIVKHADGSTSMLAYDFQAFVKSISSSNPTVFTSVSQMGVSNDGGNTFGPIQLATFTGPANVAPETLASAAAAPYSSTSAHWSRLVNAYLWNHVLQNPDGSLIVSAYANTAYSDPHTPKYGVYAYRSNDYGVTWNSVSTVANDPNIQGWNGYCEPTISFTSKGDVLAVMRTGDELPLMQARSTDGGATWGSPTPTGSLGVDPDLLLMSNGVLACSYGRPGNRLMFSADGTGANWSDRLELYEYSGSSSTGYTSLAEVAPGKLLMVYDHGEALEGVYITVSQVPEPGALILLAAGSLLLLWRRTNPFPILARILARTFVRVLRRISGENATGL